MCDVQNIDQYTPAQLSQLISSNPQLLSQLDEVQLVKILQKINPYCQVVDTVNKPVLFSITNWKEDYIRKLKMVSLVKFLDRMIYEYDEIAVKLGFDLSKTAEYKDVTKKFFDYLFKYDPKFCVRSSYQDKVDDSRDVISEEYKTQMPSLDVFERWQRFEEANCSVIKKEVYNFYQTRPSPEFAIQIYGVFDDETQTKQFKDKYGASLSVDIHKAVTNKWILLENNEETLDKIHFSDRDNDILENMIAQMKKDAEIGQKMLEKRKQDMQQQNIEANGQRDDEGLKQYIDDMNQNVRQTKQELFGINETNSKDQYPVIINNGNALERRQF